MEPGMERVCVFAFAGFKLVFTYCRLNDEQRGSHVKHGHASTYRCGLMLLNFIYILDAVRKSNLEEFKHPSVADDDTAQHHFSFSNIRCIISPDGKPKKHRVVPSESSS